MSREKNYITIPWASWLRFLLILITIATTYFGFRYIQICWTYLGLESLSKTQQYSLPQLMIVPLLILEYCSVGFIFICLVAWIKKGFFNSGLIAWFIFGLIGGLIIGLIFGLTLGLGDFIGGLILGLTLGLIPGLTFGLIVEFKN